MMTMSDCMKINPKCIGCLYNSTKTGDRKSPCETCSRKYTDNYKATYSGCFATEYKNIKQSTSV